LNVLGSFEARWSDGGQIKFTSRKVQALIAYLAVESRRTHTREQLATLLWGDTGDERARHNLRQALAKIRSCCSTLIVTKGDCLSIDTGVSTIDVLDFNRFAASNDPEHLRQCLNLYRGDLLDGFIPREPEFDEWLLLARSQLRRNACDIADRFVQKLIEQNRIDEAVEGINHRLAMDPACEPAHCKLMELLALTGRRSDALRQYQVCVEALQREFGAEPSAETKSLYLKLRSTQPENSEKDYQPDAPAVSKPAHHRPTVAVLPFDNLSSGEDNYFVDGIAEDIITALSCFHSLLVIARGSSFVYREQKVPERQMAEELGAQFLVRGSVQRSGQRVRINVQLLDAFSGMNLWGHRFDRKLEDVFLLQDEITSTLVSTLAGKVEAARLAHARRAPQERLDAYDILLQGKDHHHRFTAEDCRTCIELFERAIAIDPSYAVAHAWLACGLGQAIVFDLDEPAKLVDRSQVAAERGLALDENESESHRILAQIFLTRRDLKRSICHQERALFLNPNDGESVCSMGEILSFVGKHEEAEEWVRKSMRLNPYHPQRYWTHLARPLFHQGRCEEAIGALEHIGRLREDDHAYRVAASARLGDIPALENSLQALLSSVPAFDPMDFCQSLPYQHESDRKVVLDALTIAFRHISP